MKQRGFTVLEFLLGVILVGVVAGPILVFAARVQILNASIGQQARREAWRSFNDRAVAAGVDPALAPVFSSAANPAVPNVARIETSRAAVTALPGLPLVVPLRVVRATATIAEPRLSAAGYQLGAGTALPPRSNPAAPLEPIVMPRPVVAPADGSVVPAVSLKPAAGGAPYSLTVTATSTPGTDVSLSFDQPYGTARGSGSAKRDVTAVDLLAAVRGTAWTEYPGREERGDRAVQLGDGRTRWRVKTQDGRLQIYEPSARERFAYRIGLGAPVLSRAGVEHAPGAMLAFDYAAYTAVRQGETRLAIDFPAAVRCVFGNVWPGQSIGFQWTFGTAAGPFSGDLGPFFREDVMGLWADTLTIAAQPVLPEGSVAENASWTLTRLKTPLGVPELTSTADNTGFFQPGQMVFSAPAGPGGTRFGRLSFQNGTNLSTGPTLTLPVTP